MENRDNRRSQYEEAALSLLMDECARQEGEQLLAEFASAQQNEQIFPIPEALDAKCQAMIRREFRRRHWKNAFHKLGAVASKAAVWVLLLASLATVSILAADATGLVNISKQKWEGYFVSYHATSITVHFGPVEGSEVQDEQAVSRALRQTIPQRFRRMAEYTTYAPDSTPGLYSFYEDAEGNRIVLKTRSPGAGLVNIYSEDAQVKELRYLGHDMVMLKKENNRQLIWLDVKEGIYYYLSADGISEDQFWQLVDALLEA